MLRAAWTAAEILGAYQEQIESFDLEPGGSGDFEFSIDGEMAYSKKATGKYPEMRELTQAVVAAIDARV